MPSYPPIEPYNHGLLKVSELHSIYYEESGKSDGLPVIYLHGGPGGGCDKNDRRFFDPEVYRAVLFDQRGSGKSTPHAELSGNTTWDLVEDIEKIRRHLAIDRWVVFGGSWGSTLSLAYAEKYPQNCLGLILRGIFTLRRKELLWFYQQGADFMFPDFFAAYKKPIPEEDERDDMMAAYYKRLTGDDEEAKLACAAAWSTWETATSKLLVDPEYIKKASDPHWALAFARIECHYFVNRGWMEDGQLLRDVNKIKHLPVAIVQGRYDMVCPAITSWELFQALGGEANELVKYKIIDDAGHSASEEGIKEQLIKYADEYRSLQK